MANLNSMIKSIDSYATNINKMFDLSDKLSRATAKLNMMNKGLETTASLQDMVMAAANRSRTSYTTMTDIVSNLGQRSKGLFSNNQETIAFAETLSKMFAIAGASQEEMSGASLQLTDALSSGVLKGEDLNSVFKAAPNAIQAIADYMGVPIEKIQGLASEGKITGRTVKDALLAASGEVNEKFEEMPVTFEQVWNSIQNDLIDTFLPLIDSIANGAQFIADNWDDIEPIFYGAAAAVGAYAIGLDIMKVATIASQIASEGLNATLKKNPLLLIVSLIAIAVAAIYKWIQSVGGFQIAWMIVVDKVLYEWDMLKVGFFSVVYYILSLFNYLEMGINILAVAIENKVGDMKANVLMLLQDMVNGAIDIINKFINKLNTIPGVSINTIEKVEFGTTAKLENDAAKKSRNAALEAFIEKKKGDISDREQALETMKDNAFINSQKRQQEIVDAQSAMQDNADKAQESLNIPAFDPNTLVAAQDTELDLFAGGDEGPPNAPVAVKGTGRNDAVKVDMSEDDLQYLRDVAERDYISKFSAATLAPNIQITFGDVHENADTDIIKGKIQKILQEEIAMTAEGVY